MPKRRRALRSLGWGSGAGGQRGGGGDGRSEGEREEGEDEEKESGGEKAETSRLLKQIVEMS